jgi:hypothetical protein
MPTSTFLGFFSGAVLPAGSETPPSGSTGIGTLAPWAERLYDGHEGGGVTHTLQQYGRFEVWCGYADLNAVIGEIVGPIQVYPSAWGGSISRRLPMEHPDIPGIYASRYSYTGQGRTSASRLYQHYRVRIEYENLPYQIEGDTPFMSVSREFGTRVITLPGRMISLSTGGTLEHDYGLPIPLVNLLVTVYGAPSPPIGLILDASAAPINSEVLYLPGMPPIEPGYAIFNGEAEQVDLSYQGNVSKVVGYRFSVQTRLRWDQVISQYTGGLAYPLTPDGERVVQSSNLNLLFNF